MSEQNTAPVAEAPVSEASPEETTQDQTNQTPSEAAVQQVAKEAQKQAQAEMRKLKIKYNGREEEVEFDPNDNDYLTRQFQMAKLGQSKAQEFSNLQKEVGTFLQKLKNDPKSVLTDPNIGIDVKKFAAQILEEEIANSKKSPEQLDKERLEAEVKRLKDDQKRKEEEFKQKETERLTEQAYVQYDTMINDAIEKSDLPKTPYVVKKMADYMLLGLQNNLDLQAKDVVSIVREEMQNDLKEMFGVMPDETIEAIVGKDVINRIRRKNLARAKATPPTPIRSALKDVGRTGKEEKKEEKKLTIKELFGI
jgi:hypothetical protein